MVQPRYANAIQFANTSRNSTIHYAKKKLKKEEANSAFPVSLCHNFKPFILFIHQVKYLQMRQQIK